MKKVLASLFLGLGLVIAPLVSAATKPQVSCTMTTIPLTITQGVSTPVTLYWTAPNAKEVSIFGFTLKNVTSGSQLLLLSQTQTYTMTATRGNESATCQTTIIAN